MGVPELNKNFADSSTTGMLGTSISISIVVLIAITINSKKEGARRHPQLHHVKRYVNLPFV
jgi:hypothetical protein